MHAGQSKAGQGKVGQGRARLEQGRGRARLGQGRAIQCTAVSQYEHPVNNFGSRLY